MIPFLNLKAINAAHRAEIMDAIARVVDSGWYILGDEVRRFERQFADHCGVAHAIGVGNGLDALTLIFRAYLELGLLAEGDEVIVPANTYIASILGVSSNRLTPVLVEPNPNTLNLDSERIEEHLTPRTKAILVVHLYGQIGYDERMQAIAATYGLKIVAYAAQAHGATSIGRRVGSRGGTR